MSKAKSVCSPLVGNFKLNSKYCPTSEKEKQEMRRVPYALALCRLMYTMVCTRPNIAYGVDVINWFLSNPNKEHWTTIKWILIYLKGISPRHVFCFGGDKPLLKCTQMQI